MATALDKSLKNVIDRITAPGQLLEVGTIERFGRQLPMLKNAPPTLVAYFEHFCAQHGDTEFLVDGDQRTTFAQVHAVPAGVQVQTRRLRDPVPADHDGPVELRDLLDLLPHVL